MMVRMGMESSRGTEHCSVAGLARQMKTRGVRVNLGACGTAPGSRCTLLELCDGMRTVGVAITFAAQPPSVDPDRIGLLGFSLGAYLALSVTWVEPRVKAVVEFFGGMPISGNPLNGLL